MFSFKKNANSNASRRSNIVDSNTFNANENETEDSKSQDEHKKLQITVGISEENDEFYDAETYKNDKFYSVNGLQEVTKFADYENTFAAAMFECSVDEQSRNNNDGYRLTRLELKADENSKACTLNF
ncbi:hypothetical protein [Candidatus Mesenet endosymbiont of Agriotes lineatus]|uniref:hypothetical protein n=1 Tax=Candidatus Mesenet endosymbiont of Agriotes lineatus TaxID=3077948 RepID=UPI0030CC8C48